MLDPRDASRLTRLFPTFLGLRLLPLGLWFLLAAASGVGLVPRGVHLWVLPLSLLVTLLIDRGYRHRFGTVERDRLPFGRNWAILACVVVAYLSLHFVEVDTDPLLLLQILVLLLFLTAVLLFLPTFAQGIAAVAVFLGLTLFLALPLLLLVTSGEQPGFAGATFSLCLGLVLSLAGIVDHLLLTRSLRTIGDDGGA